MPEKSSNRGGVLKHPATRALAMTTSSFETRADVAIRWFSPIENLRIDGARCIGCIDRMGRAT